MIFGHHPSHGVVAANPRDSQVADHVLRRLDFQPRTGNQLYTLTGSAGRNPRSYTQQAIRLLRTAGWRVQADLALEPDPPRHTTRLRQYSTDRRTPRLPVAPVATAVPGWRPGR